jgi:hypothetical protein
MPITYDAGWFANSPTVTVELTCKPYWRGVETLTSTAAASAPFVTLAIVNSLGDVPALGRLIITDTASQSRRHVEWGLEGPLTYNAATSLLIDSDSMVTSGFSGTGGAPVGAYDPNATGNSAISGTAVNAPTALAGLGDLAHVGSFRVKARVRSDTVGGIAPTLRFRLTWKVADGPAASNEWAYHTTGNATYQELDLGAVTIPAVITGTQRWTGQVEAMTGTAVSETATVDYLVLVPTSAGYGKARGTYVYSPGSLSGFDDFTGTTAGGALNGRVAPSGGTWATSGSTTDFAFADALSGEQIVRATASDTGPRWAILGSTSYTNTQVDVLAYRGNTATGTTLEQGVVARWTDSSNYLRAVATRDAFGSADTRVFSLVQRVAGTDTTLASTTIPAWTPLAYFAIRLIVFSSGRTLAWFMGSSKTSILGVIEASSTALATGGTLASGKPGIYDTSTHATTATRYYDDMAVSTPAAEPIAVYTGQTMQVRYDATIRDDATGTYTGRPASYRGDRLLIPVGTSRVLVKARRNDIETVADNNVTDATQVQVAVTPRGLVVPR